MFSNFRRLYIISMIYEENILQQINKEMDRDIIYSDMHAYG